MEPPSTGQGSHMLDRVVEGKGNRKLEVSILCCGRTLNSEWGLSSGPLVH